MAPERCAAQTLSDLYDRRRNAFDFARFSLATVVLWSHCFALLGRGADWVYAASGQEDAGSLAVDSFFVLSGFLIVQSWLSDPVARRYWLKRALRIVPAMVVSLSFGAFVVGPWVVRGDAGSYLTSIRPWEHFAGVIFHRYLAIEGAFAPNPEPKLMNCSLWSLRYEVLCYALIAVLGGMFADCRRWTLVAFTVAWCSFLVASVLDLGGVGRAGIPFTLSRLAACFAGGALMFAWRESIPASKWILVVAVVGLAVAFRFGGFRLLFPGVGSYVLIRSCCTSVLRLDRFGSYGDFSYGMYVFAYPVQQTLIYLLGPQVSVGVLFGSAFVPTILLAILSWYFIEAPALGMKPR